LNYPAKGGGLNTPQLVAKIIFQSALWGFIPVIYTYDNYNMSMKFLVNVFISIVKLY
jgi:hypothetical protein